VVISSWPCLIVMERLPLLPRCSRAQTAKTRLLDDYSGQHRAIAKAALEAEFSELCSCRVWRNFLPAAIEKKGSVSEKEFLASRTIV